MLLIEYLPQAVAAKDSPTMTTTMRVNRNCMYFPFRDAEASLGGLAECLQPVLTPWLEVPVSDPIRALERSDSQ
jgi:hypothetical protein